MKRSATIHTDSGSVALVVSSVKREGDKLVIDGKALGSMRMDMIFTLEEVFNAIRIAICWDVVSYILLLPFFWLKHIIKRGGRGPTSSTDTEGGIKSCRTQYHPI